MERGGGARGGEDHAAGRKGQKGVGERWALVVSRGAARTRVRGCAVCPHRSLRQVVLSPAGSPLEGPPSISGRPPVYRHETTETCCERAPDRGASVEYIYIFFFPLCNRASDRIKLKSSTLQIREYTRETSSWIFYSPNSPSCTLLLKKKRGRLIFFSRGAYFGVCQVSSGECPVNHKICIDTTKWRYDTLIGGIVVSLAFLRVQSQLRYDRYRENLKEFFINTHAPLFSSLVCRFYALIIRFFSPPL